MTLTKKILIGIFLIFVAIQFIRPQKNLSQETSPDDIFAHYPAPDSIISLIKTACYNCHSNNSVYPWYAEIQPLAWWLNHHIAEGKGELNFSDFAAFNQRFKSHKLDEVMDEVKDGKMPLKSYLLTHPEARLTHEQRVAIVKWADDVRNSIKPRER